MSTQRMIRSEARRIVCLTASLTEIIYALGLDDRLVGVTDTCDYPQSAKTKPNEVYYGLPHQFVEAV